MRSVCLGAATAALTLGGACAPAAADSIETVFDPCSRLTLNAGAIDDARLAALGRATTLWNERAGTALTLEEAAPDEAQIPVRFQAAAGAFHGFYDDEEAVVYVNDALDSDEIAVVVAHELGHAFGLLHVEDRKSVMNRGNLTVTPNDGDVGALVELWGRCGEPAQRPR